MSALRIFLPRADGGAVRGRPGRRWAAGLAVSWLVFGAFSSASAREGDIDLALYQRMLEAHTREVDRLVGVAVDYRAIGKDPEWSVLVEQVKAARPSQLTPEGQLAYWINAYNILTIDLIVRHYPVEGIKAIGSFFSPVWNIEVAKIEGEEVSLGEIEHDILRPMGEPRIHGAIVCASISCPPLARTPFRPERLDEDLSRAMRTWLANPGKGVHIDRTTQRITISRIFDWFEEDFEKTGGVLATIARYVDADEAKWILANQKDARIGYFSYDWSLNDVD